MNPSPPANNHTHSSSPAATTSSSTSSASRPSSSSTTQACAACKYQRRKCNPDCTLAPYFPADHQRQFLNAHRLFGVSNILKIIRGLDPHRRSEAMKSIIFQSNMRAHDPVGGCYRVILDLERQYERDCHELALVLHHLSLCRQASSSSSLPSPPDPPPPPFFLPDPSDDAPLSTPLLMASADQAQQQQYYDYFYFDGTGGGGVGVDNNNNNNNMNINMDNDDHINNIANAAAATMSGNSVNNNNVGGMNGNGTGEVDMELHQQSMLIGLHQPQHQLDHQPEDDVKPLIDMFDVTHALAMGDEEEVGEITSKAADLDLASASYHCRSDLELSEIQAKKEAINPMEHVQEHDLKGAASLFTLTSRDSSFV